MNKLRVRSKDMGEDEHLPILSKWHKFQLVEEKKIGSGVDSGKRGIVRKIFGTPEGRRFYADKILPDKREAKRMMEIYQLFRSVGLPVASFAKIVRKKESDHFVYYLAMEDMAENGRYQTFELEAGLLGKFARTAHLVSYSEHPEQLQQQMVTALAVIHNNGVYNSHPGMSFLLRLDREGPKKVPCKVDFRIIDYMNFVKMKEDTPLRFKDECEKDLRLLLLGIMYHVGQYQELKQLYQTLREQKVTHYPASEEVSQ